MKKNINNIGEIGKKREMNVSLSLCVFCLVSVLFAGFPEGHYKNIKADQGFRLCFYQET